MAKTTLVILCRLLTENQKLDEIESYYTKMHTAPNEVVQLHNACKNH